MIRIYGIPRSRAFRCIWAAEEAGVAYENVTVDYKDGVKTAEFRKINPNAKIPVLQDGDLILFESLAINLHLAHKSNTLLPSGDDGSRALQWTLWAATEVEKPAMDWVMHGKVLPVGERIASKAEEGEKNLTRALEVLQGVLSQMPYLLGQNFTAADLNVACVMYGLWFNGFDLSAYPAVKTWLDTCLNRPAAKRARALREAA